MQDEIQTLRKVGVKGANDMTPELLAIHMAFAEHAGIIPEKSQYRCGICFRMHNHGERCPNSGRRYVRSGEND